MSTKKNKYFSLNNEKNICTKYVCVVMFYLFFLGNFALCMDHDTELTSFSKISPKTQKPSSPIYKVKFERQEVDFQEFPTAPYGDCGFEVLGIDRKTAVSLLLGAADDPVTRGLLLPEIKAAFYQEELGELLRESPHNDRVKKLMDAYKEVHDSLTSTPTRKVEFEQNLNAFCSEKAVYESYINAYYMKGGWLTIIPNRMHNVLISGNTSALDALARLNNIHCFVWQLSEEITLGLLHETLYRNEGEREIHMLHTYAKADTKIRNHFTRLEKVSDQKYQRSSDQPLDSTISKNKYPKHYTESNENEREKEKCGFFAFFKGAGIRIFESNNRSLGTLFGCIAGAAASITLVSTDAHTSFQIFGNSTGYPLYLNTIYKVCGVLLSTGVGGNLSSYIGASIDIITGEKTIFDGIRFLVRCCYKKPKVSPEGKTTDLTPQIEHRHFPFITSSKATLEEHKEHKHHSHDQFEAPLLSDEVLEHLLSVYHDSSNKQTQIDRLSKEILELNKLINEFQQQKCPLERVFISPCDSDQLDTFEPREKKENI